MRKTGYTCDRCGEFESAYAGTSPSKKSEHETIHVVVMPPPHGWLSLRIPHSKLLSSVPASDVDLCPKCCKLLLAWVREIYEPEAVEG